VLDPRKKDTETEKLGRNVWVPARGWILVGYFVFILVLMYHAAWVYLQAAGVLGALLQLQHGARAAVPGYCGHQLHQFLYPEQGPSFDISFSGLVCFTCWQPRGISIVQSI
jgi:hypothetical protein